MRPSDVIQETLEEKVDEMTAMIMDAIGEFCSIECECRRVIDPYDYISEKDVKNWVEKCLIRGQRQQSK